VATPAASLAGEPVDFARDIAPIFQSHCVRCHQPGNSKGGLSLATAHDLMANQYGIDAFEIWTDSSPPRNVARSAHGAVAKGRSRQADDFAGAYHAALTIDGQFGAQWIAQGPELMVTLAQPERIQRVFFSSDRTGAAGDHPVAAFVADYHIEVSLDQVAWTQSAEGRLCPKLPVGSAPARARRTLCASLLPLARVRR
jgi:hypothetical protein